jgi:uncharacterized protein YbjT (DUF2867 family)
MIPSAPLRVVLLGATGAVGRNVLAETLRSPAFASVTTIGRRPVEGVEAADAAGKLTQHVVDLADPASYRDRIAGHTTAICTLGVGEPTKSTPEEVWKVEIDYVMGFAAACKEVGVRHFSLMTSVGANPRSRFAYVRLKGEQEERVKALGFERTSLFRPSMLLTPQNRYGTSQAILLALWPRLHPLFAGPLRPYRGIRVEELGTAMVRNAARSAPPGVEVLEWDDFRRLLDTEPAD